MRASFSRRRLPLRLALLAVLVAALAPRVQAQGTPTIRRINPPSLSAPTGYTHVIESTGGRTLYISGQVALDSTGALVGVGDLRAQAVQALDNLRRALAAAGATTANLVKVNWYVTDASRIAVVREVRGNYFASDQLPASTFVEVRALARPEYMIEIEAIAQVK